MRTLLRRDLTAAIKARDGAAVAALRSMLAAIDNAEAVGVALVEPRPSAGGEHFATGAVGLGASEAERRAVSESELSALVQAQVDEWSSAALEYEALGRADRADRLRAEAAVLRRYIPSREK